MKTKTQISKQILSLVLAVVMVLSMLPVTGLTAFAADTDTGKAIQLGTSGIADGDKTNNKWDYVYYGTYENSPIKWRVLSKNGNGGTYQDNDGNSVTAPIFLLSEYVWNDIKFESTTEDDGDGQSKPNDWQNSDAQAWCRNDFAGNSFSDTEKNYVLQTTKDDAAGSLYTFKWSASKLKEDTVFFISAKEASDYLGSNNGDAGLIVASKWRLRSPYTGNSSYAGCVDLSGKVNIVYVYSTTFGARPAFNLDPSSVLFTSAAVGGKPEDFGEVAAYSGTDWKLTLKDDSRSSFSHSVESAVRTSTKVLSVTINYSGAATGANEYISAMICDADGNVTYYGRLKNVANTADANGTVEIDLSGVTMNATDTLYIFNEQYNGDYKTDYASELKAVTIPSEINAYYVTFDATGGTGAMNSVVVKSGETYTLPANDFTAPGGHQFKGWATTKDGTVITDTKITVTADTTLYAIWEKIPAEAPTVTPSGDLMLTYNGYTDEQVSVSVNEQTDYTYSYQWYDGNAQLVNGETNSTYTVPGDLAAGSYSYYCRVTAKRIDNELTAFTDSAKITVKVNKATPGVTAPTAQENLEFNGSEQALISAGSATNGTMQYALGTAEAVTGEWKTDIPKATEAGTYYVWYKVVGNENYNDVDPAHITVTIYKATPGVTAPTAQENLVYNGSEQELISAGSTTNGTMQYALGASNATAPTGGWSTDVPKARNADTYYVWYRVVGNDNYNDVDPVCITVTVAKVNITVTADDKSKTYSQADPALTWSITSGALAPNDSLTGISLSRATGEDADQYTITVSQTAGSNPNYDITLVNGTFTIAQKELTPTITGSVSKTYDGTTTVPDGLSIALDGIIGTDAVTATASFAYDGVNVGTTKINATGITLSGADAGNYKLTTTTASANVGTITQATPAYTVPTGLTATYGDTLADITLPEGFTWEAALTTAVGNVGDKEFTVTYTPSDTLNYKTVTGIVVSIEVKAAAASIATAPTAISGLIYNKTAQALITAGTANGGELQYSLSKDSGYSTTIPTGTGAGTYTVWYKVVGDSNHSDAAPVSIEVKISKADPAIGAVTAGVVNDTLDISAIALNRANTSVGGVLTVDAGQELKLGDNEIAYTFTPADTDNYESVTGKVTVTVKDTIAPTGKVTLGTNSWNEFLNNITFGLFFKETQTVSVEASDSFSGVEKIEYYAASDVLDLDGVKALADDKWTVMDGSVNVTAEDAKQFIYYIRITDKSGNIGYLATNGAEFDTTAPVIDGVHNGVTYYTTQKITVTDTNLDTVTLNGEAVTGTITLDGNKEATYIIVATDKAGNATTVTVTMKLTESLGAPLDGITEENVTSEDKDTIQDVIDQVEDLLDDEDLTEEEKATLEEIKEEAEKLIEKIEEVTEATDTENTEKVEDITPENVKPEDKTDLEKAKEDLEDALENNGDNYTEDETKAIQEEIDRIDEALDVIDRVEKVEQQIENLPDTITKDDTDEVDAAKKAYDELSDYEKTLIDPVVKAKLDGAVKAAEDVNKPADTNSPQTGDNTNLWLWIALLFVSGGAVITLTVYDRKRRTVNR